MLSSLVRDILSWHGSFVGKSIGRCHGSISFVPIWKESNDRVILKFGIGLGF